MTIEIIGLAMASTIRPTSLAALYALLAHRSPRTLMVAYVAGGLAFTMAFGLVVVYVLHGFHIHPGSGRGKGIAEIVSGAVALGFGFALLTGRVHRSEAREAPAADGHLHGMLDRRVTPRIAALAGPATHIPGVFYLIALNVIVAHKPQVVGGTLDVVTYNAIWFALPIAALVVCITNPGAARAAVGSVEHWAHRHSRAILLWVSFLAGAGLVVRGVIAL